MHVKTIHMRWSRDNRDGPRGYHHGNLKEALIRAALELIAQKGPAGFTFAEAARWAGVSPAAPYRHFRDRDDLLIDVARRGFDQFGEVLARAWGEGRPNPATAFERISRAYLQFARSEPAYYSAMFGLSRLPARRLVFASGMDRADDPRVHFLVASRACDPGRDPIVSPAGRSLVPEPGLLGMK